MFSIVELQERATIANTDLLPANFQLIRNRGTPWHASLGRYLLQYYRLMQSNLQSVVHMYRGFIRKGARVRIITFRDTTRMQSKSNRCI
jgi:hypothetical protein